MAAPPPDRASLVTRLRAAGCVFAEEEAGLLLEAAAAGRALEPLVARRVAGEPLEHILGWVEFCGRRIAVAPGVFVPRRRTELLVEVAAGLLAPGDEVLDLCCGCGAIGAALVQAVPGVRVTASDVEPAAVRIARRNLSGERVVEGDFLDPVPSRLRGRLAVIVCNAPYVPTGTIAFLPAEARDHEPRRALDGGADGLELHRRLAREGVEWLAPGGAIVVESSRDQAEVSAGVFAAVGCRTRIVRDDERDATTVVAIRTATT